LNTGRSALSKRQADAVRSDVARRADRAGYMGMPDVYSEEFARSADSLAPRRCRRSRTIRTCWAISSATSRRGRARDGTRGHDLAGKETETQRKLKAFLAAGDTPARRNEFVLAAFEHQLQITNQAARKYDPNHLNLGIRFGALPPDDVIRMGRLFDVYSHNIYEYVPDRAWIAKLYQLPASLC